MTEKTQWIRLGGLWMNRDGKSMSGKFGLARLAVFKNDRKQGDQSPDYYLCAIRDDRDDEKKGGEADDDTDSIPF